MERIISFQIERSILMHILVVDDHPMMLDGTKMLLESVEDWHVTTVNEATNIQELIQQLRPDLLLLDINLGTVNGIALAEQLKDKFELPIVLYSGYEIEDYYDLLLQQKIDGLLSKTASKDVVIQTIQAALRGDLYIPRSFLMYVSQKRGQQSEDFDFSKRDVFILEAVARGETNKAIASELDLSQRSVENYLSKIFTKLGVDSRAQAVSKAKDLHIIK